MNTLPKDMVGKLIDELSPQDFISFCSSNVDPNVTRICHMDEIWVRRLQRDFQLLVIKFPNIIRMPKTVYLKLFTDISKLAETFTKKVLRGYGKVRKFLSSEFNNFLYTEFYNISLDVLKNALHENAWENFKDLHYNSFQDYVSDSVEESFRENYVIDFFQEYFPGDSTFDGELNDVWKRHIQNPLKKFVEETIDFLRKY